MVQVFDLFIASVFEEEGDFSNDPRDRGNWSTGVVGCGYNGGTKRGIDTASYLDNLNLLPNNVRSGFPKLVKDLTDEQCAVLYRYGYWLQCDCDAIHPAIAILVADFAVNSGVSRAIKTLQTCVGSASDGVIGPATLAAIKRAAPDAGKVAALAGEYQDARLIFLTGCSGWIVNQGGWRRRCFDLAVLSGRLNAVTA